MKKFTAISLALVLALGSLTACGSTQEPADTSSSSAAASTESAAESTEAASTEAVSAEDAVDPANWTEYDNLISQIKTTTDYVEREALMHQAEDMIMETGAILPLYYYNDIYMQKSDVTNIYSNLYGFKYFMFAEAPETTLRINLASEPDTLDPALNSSVDGACMIVNSFSGLFTYDADGNVQPDLAADYTVSEDGLTYTVNLVPGLVWSDGSELNANDFVYSWNRAVNPQTAADYSYMFDVIAANEDGTLKVTASEDGQSLTIELDSPCAYFLDLLAFPAYYPVKQSEVEAAADWETNPGAWCQEAGFVTNGAYTISSWTHDQTIIMTKNPNYHRADEVKVETIEVMLSADDTAIYAAYNADNLDFIDTVPNDEIQSLLDNPEFYIVDNLGTYYVSFNVNSDLFADKTPAQANAMRRAFALLVDRDYIAENIGQTGQEPANTFIPTGMSDGHGGIFKENDDAYTYPDAEDVGYFNPSYSEENVAEAIALLESAGYVFDDNGMLSAETPITFEYLTNDGTGHVAVAEALQQDFAAIGIDMTIQTVDWNVFLDERKAGNYDIARNGWLADFNDPINMLEMWTTDSGNNDCQFGR
ncbi:peptide ABC transporter substrate-binding protein [Candidatus Acetatifactor stercoripullorum]|uniref:peptide ABC transporter substrate-binding protein n=1 Tax=Candidatus Acetatifactor stercoripullorum TaxID=2838414 RepID=UPI00298E0243|nr:ABC transporter substrate-binding protein [Candidatus Acetatifactor stercoripullorum]